MHIYLGVITHVMVATQPDATAAAGGAAALGFFAALFYLDGLGYIVLTVALYHPAFARFPAADPLGPGGGQRPRPLSRTSP